jgi:hypothetical protein
LSNSMMNSWPPGAWICCVSNAMFCAFTWTAVCPPAGAEPPADAAGADAPALAGADAPPLAGADAPADADGAADAPALGDGAGVIDGWGANVQPAFAELEHAATTIASAAPTAAERRTSMERERERTTGFWSLLRAAIPGRGHGPTRGTARMDKGRRPALTDDAGHDPTMAIASETLPPSGRCCRRGSKHRTDRPCERPSYQASTSTFFLLVPHRTARYRRAPHRAPAEGVPPRSDAPGGPTVRPQFAVRIRRLAISFGPLLPVAITLAIFGKRWL